MNGPTEVSKDWHYWDGAHEVGPFSWKTLQQLRQTGLITGTTQVRTSDGEGWRPLDEIQRERPAEDPNQRHPVDGPGEERPSAPPAPVEGSVTFPVSFGTSFVASSGGFQGSGVLSIGPAEVELRGGFALPPAVEIGGIILLLFIMYSLWPTAPVWLAFVVVFATRGLIGIIPEARRVNRRAVTVAKREGCRVDLRWVDARRFTIVLRAANEKAAKQIAERLRA